MISASPQPQIAYRKASQAFLLRKYDSALATCLAALAALAPLQPAADVSSPTTPQLRARLWTLYVNLATVLLAVPSAPSASPAKPLRIASVDGREAVDAAKDDPEKVVEFVWRQVVEGYGDVGEVDGEVVVACIILSVSRQAPKIGRQMVESWLNSIPDAVYAYLEQSAATVDEPASRRDRDHDPVLGAYDRIVELYILHVLPALRDFESARLFVNYNIYVGEEKKKKFQETLNKLQEKASRPPKKRSSSSSKKPIPPDPQPHKANGHHHSSNFLDAFSSLPLDTQTLRPPRTSVSSTTSSVIPADLLTGAFPPSPATSSPPFSPPSSVASSPRLPATRHVSSKRTAKASSSRRRTDATALRLPNMVVHYAKQLTGQGSPLVLLLVLVIIGLTVGGRRKVMWEAFKKVLEKLWQTVKMGTKITYV